MSATVSTGDSSFVVPFIAALDASGTATLTQVALAKHTVTIGGIDQTFSVTLSEADATTLLNGFTVADAGETLSVNAGAGLVAPLTAAINSALSGSNTIPAWLNSQLSNALVVDILSTLKVSVEVFSNVTIDAAGGASNMQAGLVGDVAEALYLQIPQSTLNMYKSSTTPYHPTTSALPLKAGDVLNFVFDVGALNINAVVTSSTRNASNAGVSSNNTQGLGVPTGTNTTPNAPYEFDSESLSYTAAAKRVCVAVTLGAGGAAFANLKA